VPPGPWSPHKPTGRRSAGWESFGGLRHVRVRVRVRVRDRVRVRVRVRARVRGWC
jgi:hypothetical protein